MFTPQNEGRIWSIVLKDNDRVTETMKANGVPQVLLDTIGYGAHKSYKNKFPHGSPRMFDTLLEKELNLLIRNTYLGLYPKCVVGGFKCKDCKKNLCCYESRF